MLLYLLPQLYNTVLLSMCLYCHSARALLDWTYINNSADRLQDTNVRISVHISVAKQLTVAAAAAAAVVAVAVQRAEITAALLANNNNNNLEWFMHQLHGPKGGKVKA